MYLWELFNDFGSSDDKGSSLVDRLRQSVLDVLTPLRASGVPFVSVNTIMDQVRQMRSGIDVDRGLIMQLLDPGAVKMVKKIEGDRIYFELPTDDGREVDDQQKQKDANKVAQTASKQAQKNVADS